MNVFRKQQECKVWTEERNIKEKQAWKQDLTKYTTLLLKLMRIVDCVLLQRKFSKIATLPLEVPLLVLFSESDFDALLRPPGGLRASLIKFRTSPP